MVPADFNTTNNQESIMNIVAYEAAELPEKIEQLRTFVPHKRKAQPEAAVERIRYFLSVLERNKQIVV